MKRPRYRIKFKKRLSTEGNVLFFDFMEDMNACLKVMCLIASISFASSNFGHYFKHLTFLIWCSVFISECISYQAQKYCILEVFTEA